jgi:hypothetical protein
MLLSAKKMDEWQRLIDGHDISERRAGTPTTVFSPYGNNLDVLPLPGLRDLANNNKEIKEKEVTFGGMKEIPNEK